MLTLEKQRMVIDWYVRWRITEPRQYIRNVGLDEAAGANQFNRVVRNAFQEEINKRSVKDILSHQTRGLDGRRSRKKCSKWSRAPSPWGVDVVDVRITRADYVDAITESVYRRMEAERKRVANELRSTGAAEGEKIRADADRQREVHDRQRLPRRPEDQGRWRRRSGAHVSVTPSAVTRSLPSSIAAWMPTRQTFAKKSDVMVLDPSSEFFKVMRGSGATAPAAPAGKK
jgi:membrane protease subunit HflC